MAQLMDLPQELIHLILLQTQPDDIEAFTLTSRSLHAKCGPIMPEHQRLKRQYSTISHCAVLPFGQAGKLSLVHHLPNLLKAVLYDRRIGLYVRNLVVRGCERGWVSYNQLSEPGGDIVPNPPMSSDDIKLFQETVLACLQSFAAPTFDYWHEQRMWSQDIEKGDMSAILSLLMVACPNLSALDFEDRSGASRSVFTLFELAAQTKELDFFRCLKHIRFDHTQWGNGRCHEDINRVKTVLALPSLESLDACEINAIKGESDMAGPMPYRSSAIQSICFTSCNIDDRSMFELLEATKHLRTFRLFNMSTNPFWIRAALLASAKDSLQELTLQDIITSPEEYPFIGSLRPFTALRTIAIDQDVLLPPRSHDKMRLTDHLPESLLSLKIFETDGQLLQEGRRGHWSKPYIEDLADSMSESNILPNMCTLTIKMLDIDRTEDHQNAIARLEKTFAKRQVAFSICE